MKNKTLVFTATYNEVENIAKFNIEGNIIELVHIPGFNSYQCIIRGNSIDTDLLKTFILMKIQTLPVLTFRVSAKQNLQPPLINLRHKRILSFHCRAILLFSRPNAKKSVKD